MNTVLVSMFYPVSGQAVRPLEEYIRNGQRLLDLKHPTVLYTPDSVSGALSFYPGQKSVCRSFDDVLRDRTGCVGLRLPEGRNPGKDTTEYLLIQHDKVHRCLAACATEGKSRAVFIDFGWRWSLDGLGDLLKSVDAMSDTTVLIPGAWNLQTCARGVSSHPNWFFLGGLFAGGVSSLRVFAAAQECMFENSRHSGALTWEVNTWAQASGMFPYRRYPADHNHSMISNFRGTFT